MPTKLLKRKTSRKSKSTKKTIEKDFDLFKFKDQMNKEMSRFKSKISNPLSQPILSEYNKKYKQYITDGFTISTLMLVNRIFSDSKSLPRELRNNYPLHSLLIKLVRQLMMTELELVYLSIFLDTFGWKNEKFEIMDYFIIAGLSVKKFLNSSNECIENYLCNEYPGILDKFSQWNKMEKDYNVLINITPRNINEKFNLLKRTYNSYCKNNFIDYNESVDRILHMSLPYNEGIKQVNNDKSLRQIEENHRKKLKKEKSLKKGGKAKTADDSVKKRPISFKVEKKPITPPIQINKIPFQNLSFQNRNSAINYNPKVNQMQNASNLNLYLQHSSLSNLNVNYHQILNFPNSSTMNNYGGNSNFLMGNELVKQQSDINFNDNVGLNRSNSGLEPLITRNSQSFLDGQDDVLRDCFFNKPIELKPNMSVNSLLGDYKGPESNWFNLGKMMSNTGNMGYNFKGMVQQKGMKEDDGKGNQTLKNDLGLFSSISNANPPLNAFGGFNLGQPSINNTQNKKNLLVVFKEMEKGKE